VTDYRSHFIALILTSTVCMIGATHIYLSLSKSPFFLLILLSSSLNGSPNFLFFTHFSSRIQSAIYGSSSSLMTFLFFFDRGPYLEPLVKGFFEDLMCVA